MLKVSAVSAGYGGFQALFDVSLEVNAGETERVDVQLQKRRR